MMLIRFHVNVLLVNVNQKKNNTVDKIIQLKVKIVETISEKRPIFVLSNDKSFHTSFN